MPGITNIENNTLLFCNCKVENGLAEFSVNNTLPNTLLKPIAKYINGLDKNKVILVVRSEKEHYTPGPFPETNKVRKLVRLLKKEVRVFYQEPWPAPVPLFNTDDAVVLRFGYNEGSEFDKSTASKTKYEIGLEDGKYNLLINNKTTIKLVADLI